MKTLLTLLLASVAAFGAGTVTPLGPTKLGNSETQVLQIDWTGDASTGSVPVYTIAGLRDPQYQGMVIVGVELAPLTPAPTTLYDVTITDAYGVDILGGLGANLSATTGVYVPIAGNVPPLTGALTLTLTNNSVASAQGRILVYLAKTALTLATVNNAPGTCGDATHVCQVTVNRKGLTTSTTEVAISGGGSGITALTGDVTATGPGSAAATLATVNSNTGACGDSTHVCQVTLNAKGLATAATEVAIGGGDVEGPASATDSCAALYDGTTGKLIKDSPLCYDATKNGVSYYQGGTSGGVAFSTANIAGTATTLIWPTDSSTAADGYVLSMGAVATCPTLLPATAPSTCRFMTWAAGGTGGGGLSGSSSIDFASMADGACIDNTFTLTGLSAGQSLSLGLPSTLTSGIMGNAIASASNTAKIRLCNTSGATVDLGALTYSVAAPTAISGSGTINFSSIVDGACTTASTFTLTGAAAGTRLSMGFPAALETGLIGRMVASAADTISVQLCNYSGAAVDPASATFSAAIL